MRIPLSTYRLQFGRGLGFREARELLPYLQRLGITDIYASPIFQANSDSASGYDIVDPTRLSPALGTWDDFIALCTELRRLDMGFILDIVPNHMSDAASNLWWKDVLENGPCSPYAYYFDIEWDPPSHARGEKMVWPILGSPYAEALERRELALTFSEEGFTIQYFERALPIDPCTYGAVLSGVPEAADLEEFVRSLPPNTTTDAEAIKLRQAQVRELKHRLWDLYQKDEAFRAHLDENLRIFNGEPEDPRSFDRLDALLAQQAYVLSFWKVAREKVNYRRFFDIADLVGINVEDPQVFAATHSLIFQLVDEGWVTGLRVDHIDGLYDPFEYLRRLRERLPDCFIVVEKILEQQESLCSDWPVSGTTGYDFINALGSTTVNPEGLERIGAAYQNAGGRGALAGVVYEERKHVIAQLFAGEAHSLSLHLNLLAESDRYAKDASPQELNTALIEVTACLPVYRTYTRSFQVRPQDLQSIDEAFRDARRLNPHVSESIWNFVRRVLLLDCPPNLAPEDRARWKQFVQRWQQFCGPVMAKGKEDTAFYIYNRLISMNEVGGQDRPWSVEEFHRFAETRAKSWPYSLNAGTTHDTKRGEDVRARIHVLADIPDVWIRHVKRWRTWNARCKRILDGTSVPGPNEEYFIYQMLVGAWPLDPDETETFTGRLQAALVKSWREEKLFTSWTNPHKDYEDAVAEFVATILTPAAENRFLPDFLKLQHRVAQSGACLSLAQTLVRLLSPGVPDIYQGSELWELSMVDPDNRRPVDFAKRQSLLADALKRSVGDLMKNWQCGSVKQFVVQKTLEFRRENAEVFRGGEYLPLEAVGPHAAHVIAFARHSGMTWTIAVAPRFPGKLPKLSWPSIGKGSLADTELSFPLNAPRHWIDRFTEEILEVPGSGRVSMAAILRHFPIAFLTALPE